MGSMEPVSNSRSRADADTHTEAVATVPTPRYFELDVESIKTPPFVCADVQPKTTLFVGGISPEDVRQGGVGDCTLQASLASLARTKAGRDFLETNVHANRDGAGNVTSYTVTLFKKNAASTYERTNVEVPNSCFASRGFTHAIGADGAVEVWPRVYEQAMLRANGGPCSNMPEAMNILTGKPAVGVSTNDANLSGKLARAYALGKVQVLSTTGRVTIDIAEPKLKAAHAYTLMGIEARPVRQADGSYQVEAVHPAKPVGIRQPTTTDDRRGEEILFGLQPSGRAMKPMSLLGAALLVGVPAMAMAQGRPSVSPVLSVNAQTGLRAPDPACTCASPESFPAPSKYADECSLLTICMDVHYAEYDARVRSTNAFGLLLATHYVESMVYDATISFRTSDGDSTYRAHIGDVVPTPRGRARVVQVYRSFVENWDDGRVTLRLLEPRTSSNVFVSSGAPSHVHGIAMTMVRANAGVATIVVVDGTTRTLDVKKGDVVTTSRGALHVANVVDGVMDGAIGWAEIDSAAQ
jgi:hypothetical protein